jgi:hypothetical protein
MQLKLEARGHRRRAHVAMRATRCPTTRSASSRRCSNRATAATSTSRPRSTRI